MSRNGFILLCVFIITTFQDILAYSNIEFESSASRKEESNLENSDVRSYDKCFCTYDYENSFVKARVKDKILKKADVIMQGETVSFECRYVSMVLIWQNGFRFFGRANMTCNTCKKWQSKDLPTCKPALKINTAVGYEEDLAVVSGGILEVQKGESRRFSCSNMWKQPQWIYGEKEGVLVNNTEDSVQEESVYVSYLYIKQADDIHSGIYSCFTRSNKGQQTSSSQLHLQVVDTCIVPVIENGEIGKFVPINTRWYTSEDFRIVSSGQIVSSDEKLFLRCKNGFSPSRNSIFLENNLLEVRCLDGYWTEVLQCIKTIDEERSVTTPTINTPSPAESITQENRENVNDMIYPDCFCTYDSDKNTDVVARSGHKLLKRGNTVGAGETVSFECNMTNSILSWDNGLRYYGKAYMTCRRCQVWSGKDLPTCLRLFKYDTFIHSEEDLTFLPGGIIHIQEGQRYQFSCVSAWDIPQWNYGFKEGIIESQSEILIQKLFYYTSKLEIMQAAKEHNGKYECSVEREGFISVLTTLHLQDFVNCLKFPISAGLQVEYSADVSVGSVATITCSSRQRTETFYSICLENGMWSNDAPSCEVTAQCSYHPPPIEHGYVEYNSSMIHGSVATYTCEYPYILVGDPLQCVWGKWEGELPQCQIRTNFVSCSRFPVSTGLQIEYSKDVFTGSVATFSCSSGQQIGNLYSRCLENGSWSHSPPSCKDPHCSISNLLSSLPANVEIDMTKVNDEHIPSGSEVDLTCDNSIISGNSKALCGELGKWKLGNFQCVPGCLLNVDPFSDLIVQPMKDSYRTGETVLLSCPPSYELSSKVEKIMCLNGMWSDDLPECMEYDGMW